MNSLNIRKNDKGMSLVELLVAIGIFAASIVPLLFAFVYSTGYSFKAQRTMQSTGIAQAIIEYSKGANVSATKIQSALSSETSFESNFHFDVSSVTASGNTFTISGVKAANISSDPTSVDRGNASRRAYDVIVNIEDVMGGTGTPVQVGFNDCSSIQSMSNTTANFGALLAQNLKMQDENAIGALASIIDTEVVKPSNIHTTRVGGGASYSGSQDLTACFDVDTDLKLEELAIDRQIKIVVENSEVNVYIYYYSVGYDADHDGSPETIKLKPVTTTLDDGHEYVLTCEGNLTGDYNIASGSSTPVYMADLEGDGDADCKNTIASYPVSAVFFYYYPRYLSTGSDIVNFKDYFVLENNMTTAFAYTRDGNNYTVDHLDYYLFKQVDNTMSYTSRQSGEYSYCPTISVSTTSFDTYLYDNFLDYYYIDPGTGEVKVYGLEGQAGSYASLLKNKTAIDPGYPVILGDFCYNMTNYDVRAYSGAPAAYSYSVALRNLEDEVKSGPGITNHWNPRNGSESSTANYHHQGESYVLSDRAYLPYWHMDRKVDTANSVFSWTDSLISRYKIEVIVYSAGHAGDSNYEIERMESEFLNW